MVSSERLKVLWSDQGYRQMMVASHTGKRQTEESNQKRSIILKGHPFWGLRKQSRETIEKRREAMLSRHARKGIQKPCENCGKEFYAPNYSIKKGFGKYCSSKCSGQKGTKEIRRKETCALVEWQSIMGGLVFRPQTFDGVWVTPNGDLKLLELKFGADKLRPSQKLAKDALKPDNLLVVKYSKDGKFLSVQA